MTDLARLATAAAFERDERIRLYPGLIAKDKIGRHQAEEDTRMWRAIAAFLGDGAFSWGQSAPDNAWALMRDTAAEAHKRREAACRKEPDDRALAERRDNVWLIYDLLRRIAETMALPLPSLDEIGPGGMREARRQLAEWKEALEA